MIVEHAIYKYIKKRKESKKNFPSPSEDREIKEHFSIFDTGLLSDTQVYSLFTEYTTIVKVVVGVIFAIVAYLFNRNCHNVLLLLFVMLFAFFFSISYLILTIIFTIFRFKNICYYDPFSKMLQILSNTGEGFRCLFTKKCGSVLNSEVRNEINKLPSPSNNSNNKSKIYYRNTVWGPIKEKSINKNKSFSYNKNTRNINNDRCSWGALKRFWNYGMDFSMCDNNSSNSNKSISNKYKSLSNKSTTYYSAKLKQSI